MAPIRRRRSILGHLLADGGNSRDQSTAVAGPSNNFDFWRSTTRDIGFGVGGSATTRRSSLGLGDLNSIVKRRRISFKDTLRRSINTARMLHVEIGEEDDPNLWRTYDMCRPSKNDLNPYFIRQIARSLQEHDLEHKIDLEIKMREGTTKLLAASHHPAQLLEAAKSLLTSNERMVVYLSELQRRKGAESAAGQQQQLNSSRSSSPTSDSRARLCVSDIRMPLIWKEGDHFKNKGDYRRFAVFCLLRVGTDIYDTAMINRVDRCMTDISFDGDQFVFNDVPPNFQFRLEVYSHVLQDDLSIASTPRKIRHRINDSLSRTVGRKLAASVKDELNAAADIGPKYELVAHATLTLDDVDDNITTHDFQIENTEMVSQSQLPLFGHFCCRLAAQPDFLAAEQQLEILHSGPLTLKSMSDDDTPDRQFSAVLQASGISLSSSSSVNDSNPELRIPITKDTVVAEDGDSGHVGFSVTNVDEGRTVTHHLRTSTEEESDRWLKELNGIVRSHDVWKQAATAVMEIYSPVTKRMPLFGVSRKASLYELTSLKDSPEAAAVSHGENGGGESSSTTSSLSSLPAAASSSSVATRSRSSSISSATTSSGCTNSYDARQARHRLSCHETTV